MKYLILSFLAGTIFGLGSIITKIMIVEIEITALLINPLFLIIMTAGVIGFLIFQESLTKEKVSHASLVSTSSATTLSVIGGLLLGESVTLTEIIGIMIITIGIIILILKSK